MRFFTLISLKYLRWFYRNSIVKIIKIIEEGRKLWIINKKTLVLRVFYTLSVGYIYPVCGVYIPCPSSIYTLSVGYIYPVRMSGIYVTREIYPVSRVYIPCPLGIYTLAVGHRCPVRRVYTLFIGHKYTRIRVGIYPLTGYISAYPLSALPKIPVLYPLYTRSCPI